MAAISNRFIVTALTDGQSVTGELVATRSLWQAIDSGGNPIPNWAGEEEGKRPKLYPLLQTGGQVVAPKSVQWKYNNEVISFNPTTHLNTNDSFAGTFKETTYTPSGGVSVPAIIIMKNLASSGGNEDNDTISISGTVSVNDTDLAFEAMQGVRITKAGESDSVGELILVDGHNQLDGDGDSVRIQALLHTSSSNAATGNYTVDWYLNGVKKTTTTGTNDNHIITVTGAEVTDYVVVEARFNVNSTQVATAFIGIDDIGDQDQMQMAYTVYATSGAVPGSIIQNNTTAAVLKPGQSVLYGFWIGKKDDPLDYSTGWSYAIRAYSADNKLVGSPTASEITDVSGDRRIDQPTNNTSFNVGGTTIGNVGTMPISYGQCVNNGGQVSVFVYASK
jgi:hypothetical protein